MKINDYMTLDSSVVIVSREKWFKRVWYLISNPFRYLLKGVWKI